MHTSADVVVSPTTTRPDVRVRLLVGLFRLAGVVMCAAFLAMVMPFEWMAANHRSLGLGEFPHAPIVEYLARSVAALYGFHGVLLLVLSSDPLRYRPLVWYIASMNVAFGVFMTLIDLEAGLPTWWTLVEGPPIIAFGIVIAFLNRSLAANP